MSNRFKVYKKQWQKWHPLSRAIYNRIMSSTLSHQHEITGRPKNEPLLNRQGWRAICHNIAFEAACDFNKDRPEHIIGYAEWLDKTAGYAKKGSIEEFDSLELVEMARKVERLSRNRKISGLLSGWLGDCSRPLRVSARLISSELKK